MPPVGFNRAPFGGSGGHSARAAAKPLASGRGSTPQSHALAPELGGASCSSSSSSALDGAFSLGARSCAFAGVNRRLAQRQRQTQQVVQQHQEQPHHLGSFQRGRSRLSLEAVAAPERSAVAPAPPASAPMGAMKTVTVQLEDRSYPIYIGAGLLQQAELLCKHIPGKRVLIVTNETIAPLYLEA